MFKRTLYAFTSAIKGLSITLRHFFAARRARKELDIKQENYFDKQQGVTTIQYPKEEIPIPEVARYQLDVEIDDCIVCDLCAKACPVDCIDIEAIKATEAIGKTSDGSVKRLYAAKFDIDMAKCMYCGLCTVVCPTECITMTDNYDRSTSKLADFIYQFSEMSESEISEKKEEFARVQAEKEAAKRK
ncbi:4Fe-4S dicluster domain-containing protein [Olivibacter sp. SDN3]|uniref:4Fe-4S binding protein n=1 Tax=Olivibacter sp. SDN3 TaxID=2764720 RepID=UPI001650F851|nr:4Fe-4S binding protein [Olivibacter sp. SDN3]QNL52119.1 4Fe-4S dicluster domain-containing protein [Olivibacter sp. SDN3]